MKLYESSLRNIIKVCLEESLSERIETGTAGARRAMQRKFRLGGAAGSQRRLGSFGTESYEAGTINGEPAEVALTKGYERNPTTHTKGLALDFGNSPSAFSVMTSALGFVQQGTVKILDETKLNPAFLPSRASGLESTHPHWHVQVEQSAGEIITATGYRFIAGAANQLKTNQMYGDSYIIEGSGPLTLSDQAISHFIEGIDSASVPDKPTIRQVLQVLVSAIILSGGWTPLRITRGTSTAAEQAAIVISNWNRIKESHSIEEAKQYLIRTYGNSIAGYPTSIVNDALSGLDANT